MYWIFEHLFENRPWDEYRFRFDVRGSPKGSFRSRQDGVRRITAIWYVLWSSAIQPIQHFSEDLCQGRGRDRHTLLDIFRSDEQTVVTQLREAPERADSLRCIL